MSFSVAQIQLGSIHIIIFTLIPPRSEQDIRVYTFPTDNSFINKQVQGTFTGSKAAEIKGGRKYRVSHRATSR